MLLKKCSEGRRKFACQVVEKTPTPVAGQPRGTGWVGG